MKILILEWDSFGEEYISDAFRDAGCEVDRYAWPYGREPMRENKRLEEALTEYIRSRNFHFIFSFNFFPVAAKICNQQGIKYVAWVYDSPYLLLYSKHTQYATNQIYIFDKAICREFWKKGFGNVFYLPLAVPVEYYNKLKAEEGKSYRSEISFVGSTYKEMRNDFYSYLKELDAYTSGYLDAVVNAQKEIYGSFILEDCLAENVLEKLRAVCPIEKGEDEWETDGWIYANYFLARRVTGIQRTELLKLLAEKYEVRLYTPEQTPELTRIANGGPVDYIKQMPLVFKNSKINLNITLRSIHSGIPLRAMDIMGCGGFLITNYQEDFLEFFEPDRDFVYYGDNEDLLRKVEYYMTHEDERKAIARNGYEKVAAFHTYRHRVWAILGRVMDINEKG